MRRVIVLITIIMSISLVIPVSSYSITGYYTDLQGNVVDFITFDGDYLLVEALQTDCIYCELQFPILQQIHGNYSSDIQILSLAVFSDSETLQDVIDFNNEFPASWSIGLDSGSYQDDYSIGGTPTILLFDPDGKVLHRFNELVSYDELSLSIENYVISGMTLKTSETLSPPQPPPISVARTVVIITMVVLLYWKFSINKIEK